MTATNDSAFSAKHAASLVSASSRPATAGPTTRAVLTSIEFSAIAFARSPRSAMKWTYIDCRSGRSNAEHVPSHSASTIRCHVWIQPNATSTASTIACTSISDCVDQQPAAAVDPVGEHAGEIAEQQDADVGAERDDAEQPRRSGQPIR